MKRRHVHVFFFGRVQGVGFRFSALDEAEKRNIRGWVKNLDDGSVELYAEGEPTEIEGMLASLKASTRIEKMLFEEIEDKGEYLDFQIVF